MAPKNKKIKTNHVESNVVDPIIKTNPVTQPTVEEAEKEPEWINLEDLEESDIDDEYGDMVVEQRLLVNNEVRLYLPSLLSNGSRKLTEKNLLIRTLWNVLQMILN